jgi:NTE family protein
VTDAQRHRPDALVLGSGGTLGEAWMRGLLDGAGAAAGIDFRDCEYFVGTSAGSIVASLLAAGRAPDSGAEARAARDWADAAESEPRRRFPVLGRLTAAAAVPLAPLALASVTPGGAVVRAAALKAVPHATRSMAGLGRMIDAEGARFDGRLRIVAVDRRSGKRVVFGAPAAPDATVGQAVLASCSVPGLFAPIRIGEREYVDGGVWSPTNLDRAPTVSGSRVLCLNPTGSLRPRVGAPFGAVGPVSRTLAGIEALTLERRGAHVTTVSPDAATQAAMGPNLMDAGPRSRVIAAGLAQGRALPAVRPE